ncbi:hypothetical protein OESDEN_19088 [Oesophagostomum dentatum]|uniref:Uncharacterized protein n=1 Tax=Oesophagostomum dentatum TaxID=61180 RepID=A0A0B1SBH2_OESDE|nr:hypothetical protein OESDEN_19088 [Oesophagostomum dentatum]
MAMVWARSAGNLLASTCTKCSAKPAQNRFLLEMLV